MSNRHPSRRKCACGDKSAKLVQWAKLMRQIQLLRDSLDAAKGVIVPHPTAVASLECVDIILGDLLNECPLDGE